MKTHTQHTRTNYFILSSFIFFQFVFIFICLVVWCVCVCMCSCFGVCKLGAINCVQISLDGLHVLVGSANGSIGILDLASTAYQTRK